MADHVFCRKMLREVVQDVRKHVPAADRKKCWAHRTFGVGEFHGPNGFFWYGDVCCKWAARYKGWGAYLAHIAVEGYKIEHSDS